MFALGPNRRVVEMGRRLELVAAIVVAVGLWAFETANGAEPFMLKVTPGKELGQGTVLFPNSDDLGTGTFRFDIAPDALALGRQSAVVIHSFVLEAPAHGSFDMTVAVPLSNRSIRVELSRPPQIERLYRGTFAVPQDFDPKRRHALAVTFTKWKVTDVTMDGKKLSPR
jgi:hypothetical protein